MHPTNSMSTMTANRIKKINNLVLLEGVDVVLLGGADVESFDVAVDDEVVDDVGDDVGDVGDAETVSFCVVSFFSFVFISDVGLSFESVVFGEGEGGSLLSWGSASAEDAEIRRTDINNVTPRMTFIFIMTVCADYPVERSRAKR